MKRILFFTTCFWLVNIAAFGQTLEEKAAAVQQSNAQLSQQQMANNAALETLKFQMIRRDLETVGLPSTVPGAAIVWHNAYCLEYAEQHEQARWVAHIIPPEVTTGAVLRTNDFRPDPDIATGSAVEADYLLKFLQKDSTWKYDGFGYDRGHLAPSADFRWSQKALSESYFYSNTSPQKAEFNRGAWGQLEDRIRGYLFRNPGAQVYVVTGPVLSDTLPVIERGVNKVSIPKRFWKVALDLKAQKAIGFIMPNVLVSYPLASFAVPVDWVEKETGIDFFSNLPDDLENKLEAQRIPEDWLPEIAAGDVEPIYPEDLEKGTFNTIQAKGLAGSSKEYTVCGTVVGARTSRAGNILLNLDKQFPNQIFTVFIKKEFIPNFSYNPELVLKGKKICVTGRIANLDGTPAMYIENEKKIK